MRFSWAIGATALFQCLSIAQEAQHPFSPFSTSNQQPLLPSDTDPDTDTPSWRENLLSLHRSLVEIPSISGTEGDVGKFLADYLTRRGYTTPLQFVAPRNNTPDGEGRFNVLAWRGDTRNPKARVVVTSHIDVVPPHIPYGREEGVLRSSTRIWGRGSVDAKASVAAQIQALENLLEDGKIAEDEVMLLFVVGEERWGDGMHAFSDSLQEMEPRPHLDAVIFGEPTENKLACGHKGGLFCDLTATGTAGHSGYPSLGKSANELMVRAMYKCLETELGSDQQFGNTTFNIGQFDGGVAANVIPDYAAAKIAARVAIGPQDEGADIVKGKILDILKGVDADAFSLECSHGYGVVVSKCDVDGFETAIMNYGTDIPNLQGDHARYLYGPGTILVAHGDHENLTVADLEEAVGGYQRLILHALKQSK